MVSPHLQLKWLLILVYRAMKRRKDIDFMRNTCCYFVLYKKRGLSILYFVQTFIIIKVCCPILNCPIVFTIIVIYSPAMLMNLWWLIQFTDLGFVCNMEHAHIDSNIFLGYVTLWKVIILSRSFSSPQILHSSVPRTYSCSEFHIVYAVAANCRFIPRERSLYIYWVEISMGPRISPNAVALCGP